MAFMTRVCEQKFLGVNMALLSSAKHRDQTSTIKILEIPIRVTIYITLPP